MKRIAWKFAASTAIIGATTVGGAINIVGPAPASAYQAQARGSEAATQLYERAAKAVAENKLPEAIALLEQAVMIAPRDAGYRLLLADAYMKSGRFRSAESTYQDVLTIDPSRSRAGLAMALMQVANGRQHQAMAQLEQLEGNAAPVDLGLAYAVAGSPQRAIDLLEPEARSVNATPRVRQNLALAYAFGGDWERARTIAAQDVSPADLSARMAQWAALASRANAPDQVAALLGVNPTHDAGQPVRLALRQGPPAVIAVEPPVALASAEPVAIPEARPEPVVFEAPQVVRVAEPAPSVAPAPQRVAFAAAAPAAPIVVPAPVAAVATPAPVVAEVTPPAVVPAPRVADIAPPPVAWAEAQPVEVPAPVAAPAPAEAPAADAVEYAELEASEWGVDERGAVTLPKEEPAAERVPVRVQYAAAAQSLVRPDPVVMPVASRAARALAPLARRALRATPLPGTRSASGKYVVQIGAFSSAANAARAWETYANKFGLKSEQPVTMTIDHQGRLLHRVAISGFVGRGEASQVCRVIKARGGACFVRSNAGDAAIDWAARYSRQG
jgi:Flp pilus assembly protein TadD